MQFFHFKFFLSHFHHSLVLWIQCVFSVSFHRILMLPSFVCFLLFLKSAYSCCCWKTIGFLGNRITFYFSVLCVVFLPWHIQQCLFGFNRNRFKILFGSKFLFVTDALHTVLLLHTTTTSEKKSTNSNECTRWMKNSLFRLEKQTRTNLRCYCYFIVSCIYDVFPFQ